MPRSGPTLAVAEFDATMDIRVVRRVALMYARGADDAIDRPAHVRAGSGLAWVGSKLAVVQDDANFIALVNVQTGVAECITLPAGDGGLRQFDDARGNKAFKNDFESLVAVSSGDNVRLLAIGSGSTLRRERIAVVDHVMSAPKVRVVHVPKFYAALRERREFSGCELNVEGAAIVGDRLRIFNRGNGAEREGVRAVNATCDVNFEQFVAHLENADGAPVPPLLDVCQYELGEVAGTKLSFTDAAVLTADWASVTGFTPGNEYLARAQGDSSEPPIVYAAAAEASPDVVQDGEVLGSVIGMARYVNGKRLLHWANLRGEDGSETRLKVEGIAAGAQVGQLYVVVDGDEHDKPCELFELSMRPALTQR